MKGRYVDYPVQNNLFMLPKEVWRGAAIEHTTRTLCCSTPEVVVCLFFLVSVSPACISFCMCLRSYVCCFMCVTVWVCVCTFVAMCLYIYVLSSLFGISVGSGPGCQRSPPTCMPHFRQLGLCNAPCGANSSLSLGDPSSCGQPATCARNCYSCFYPHFSSTFTGSGEVLGWAD